MANRIDQDIFKPIPMAVWKGYTKLGTIYPKGWTYNGEVLSEDLGVPSKPKYNRQLQKYMKARNKL